MKQLSYFIDENWNEVSTYYCPDDVEIECKEHGTFNPTDWWTQAEISQMMIDQGFIDCPWCCAEISGI